MRILAFIASFLFLGNAFAAGKFTCGSFTNEAGLSLLDLRATIYQSEEDLTLVVGKRLQISQSYSLVYSEGPVNGATLFKAGPYDVTYPQGEKAFVVSQGEFSALCK